MPTAGFYDEQAIQELVKECAKMSIMDHPNILTLRGVCLDGGPAPYIVMPFMTNGSLLSYLKRERGGLVITSNLDDEDKVSNSV